MLLMGGLLLGGVRASQSIDAQGATPDPVTLRLWPAGQGRIDVTQDGAPVGSCDFLYVIDNEGACLVQVAAGTPVTVTASPEPGAELLVPEEQDALPDFPVPHPSFVRWTRSECVGTGPCTFTPDDDLDWVGAVFTPLQLEVGLDDSAMGTGTVGVLSPAGTVGSLPCGPTAFPDGTSECHGAFPADSSVVLVPSGEPATWGPGCDSVAGDPPRCTVVVNNIRTFASLAFNGLVAPSFPFNITARLHIALAGSGHGRVTGDGLDCGTQCTSDSVTYQSPVTLNATADPGSHFVRWEGVCSTDPVCAFSGGSETRVGAVFDGPAGTTTTATVVTTAPPVVTTTGTTSSVTTAIVVSAFSPRIQQARAKRLAGHRIVVVTLVVDRLAGATLRLSKNGRAIATTHWELHPGRTLAKLRVPKALKAGRCRLQVRIVAGGASRTFTTAVKIGR
jgi:hypothetical protein